MLYKNDIGVFFSCRMGWWRLIVTSWLYGNCDVTLHSYDLFIRKMEMFSFRKESNLLHFGTPVPPINSRMDANIFVRAFLKNYIVIMENTILLVIWTKNHESFSICILRIPCLDLHLYNPRYFRYFATAWAASLR